MINHLQIEHSLVSCGHSKHFPKICKHFFAFSTGKTRYPAQWTRAWRTRADVHARRRQTVVIKFACARSAKSFEKTGLFSAVAKIESRAILFCAGCSRITSCCGFHLLWQQIFFSKKCAR